MTPKKEEEGKREEQTDWDNEKEKDIGDGWHNFGKNFPKTTHPKSPPLTSYVHTPNQFDPDGD